MESVNIILAAEEAFAREVALAGIVKNPPALWYSLIPGMFIFDFLKRTAAVRKYTHHYLFPRRQALRTAQQTVQSGVDPASLRSEVETAVIQRLKQLKAGSQHAIDSQIRVIDILTDHYTPLLTKDGKDYVDLVRQAYPQLEEYQSMINTLNSAENEFIDTVCAEKGISNDSKTRMRAEQQEVIDRRQKTIEKIYTESLN